MAFSTFGGLVTLTHSASGTRDSDGNQREDVPQTTKSVPMTAEAGSARGVSQLDRDGSFNSASSSWDLTAINLDGRGSKDFTSLYCRFVITHKSGAGSFSFAKGASNGLTGFPTQTVSANHPILFYDCPTAVGSGAKAIDWTLSGTCEVEVTIYGLAAA